MKRLKEPKQKSEKPSAPASATGSFTSFTARTEPTQPLGGPGLGGLSEPTRLAMSLIARRAATADDALEPIIDLLVGGDAAKRDAIVDAFRTNEPLQEQWLRTYEILRA